MRVNITKICAVYLHDKYEIRGDFRKFTDMVRGISGIAAIKY